MTPDDDDDDDTDRIVRALRSTRGVPDDIRVLGGATAPSSAFPSCVCLGDAQGWFCSGVLVSPTVVLTAAHCGAGITRALIGRDHIPATLDDQRGIVAVERVELHAFDRTAAERRDIAIVFLAAAAAPPFAHLATDEQLAAARSVQVAGYGNDDRDGTAGFGVLRTVRVALGPIARAPDQHAALGAQHGYHPPSEFVAGRRMLGMDTCTGDSGGPAYIMVGKELRLAGLTSRPSADRDHPCGDGGVYVRPLAYRTWLEGRGVHLTVG